jgi:catechol 2,3-dioxygenase-like lactoylglutathione lyase family enzyme
MISRVLLETIVTKDLDRAVRAWQETIGWQCVVEGPVDDALAVFWRVESSTYPRFALVAPEGSDRGYLRVLEGPEDDESGSFHHPGLFNAELLCRDVDELHARLQSSREFQLLCGPTTYDLASAGGACSRSFATRGPGGAGVFFTTYLSVPPPRQLPVCRQLVDSMFNSALAVEDGEAMEAFFEGVLGMTRRLEGRIASPAINRILDLPEEWGFHMVVYKGEGEGLIEVDVHEHPLPDGFGAPTGRLKPGNSFLTLEAIDFDEVMQRAAEASVVLSRETVLAQPPYGGRQAALLRGPAGEPVEVIEAA